MKIPVLTAALLQAALVLPATAATVIPLESRATYLHTFNDSQALPSYVLRLADLGFTPGDHLHLDVVGNIDNGPGGDTFTLTMGPFSSSSTLLGAEQRYRVPGALATDAPNFVSSNTYFGNQPTDIPQDFSFDKPAGITVTVPVGAQYLFLAKSDQLYSDNSDPNHNYGVLIGLAPVPEPASAALMLLGVAGLACRLQRKQGEAQ